LSEEDEARYRRALRRIVEIGDKPDTSAAWTVRGKDRAFDEMLRLAKEALNRE